MHAWDGIRHAVTLLRPDGWTYRNRPLWRIGATGYGAVMLLDNEGQAWDFHLDDSSSSGLRYGNEGGAGKIRRMLWPQEREATP